MNGKNKSFNITKEFSFVLGHTLDEHQGKCKNAHGHNYRILVTVQSNELNNGMIIDFYDLSKIVQPVLEEFDHAFAINTNALDIFEKDLTDVLKKHNRKIIELPFRSTTENLSRYFFDRISNLLDCSSHQVLKVTVYETPTSFAEYGEKG